MDGLFRLLPAQSSDVMGEAARRELDADLREALMDGLEGMTDVECSLNFRPGPANLSARGSRFFGA
jgi:hypothetical protein